MPEKPPHELILSEESVPENTVLWRYFSFERFLDVLKTHSLWFSRPFAFEDLWEGLFPPPTTPRPKAYRSRRLTKISGSGSSGTGALIS
jgi:hypothetical protein